MILIENSPNSHHPSALSHDEKWRIATGPVRWYFLAKFQTLKSIRPLLQINTTIRSGFILRVQCFKTTYPYHHRCLAVKVIKCLCLNTQNKWRCIPLVKYERMIYSHLPIEHLIQMLTNSCRVHWNFVFRNSFSFLYLISWNVYH